MAMRRRAFLVLGLCAGLFVWAAGSRAATPPAAARSGAAAKSGAAAGFALHDGDRVVFLGDSITEQRLYTTYL